MVTLELKTSGRQYQRQFVAAIRGNLIRALTELITNSDDSYRRLGETGRKELGLIQVFYDRNHRHVAVVDWAEGMDAGDMQAMYPSYGGATSGLYDDLNVRGYFGKGLKDVMFSMLKGLVQSIKNDQLFIARFYWEEDRPVIEISDTPRKVTKAIRHKLGIPHGNGTRISFEIPKDISLPRHASLLKHLSNFYMLRLINSSADRKVVLHTHQGKSKTYENVIQYRFPAGERVLKDSFTVEYGQPYRVDLELYRAETPLTQSGEGREGGILIYDPAVAVFDLTLFGYDREELASRLFGTLALHDFAKLLKANEKVLTDTRDGLDRHHPFTQALAEQVEARLRPLIEWERHQQLHHTPDHITHSQRNRLGHSLDQINSLLGDLSGLRLAAGEINLPGLEMPPDGGLEFSPSRLTLTSGRKTAVRLRVDTSLIPPGSRVELRVAAGHISYEPKSFEVLSQPGQLVMTQRVILYSSRAGEQATLEACHRNLCGKLPVKVVAGGLLLPDDEMTFAPDVMHLADNARRYAKLYLREHLTQAGEEISLKVDNPQVELGVKSIRLNPADFHDGLAEIRVPVKGTGIGEKAKVTATLNSHSASLAVEVVSRMERRERGSRIVTGYRFDRTTPSRVRASYDEETGLIWIYLRNPIVERYFSDLPLNVALETPHCQILLAEIIMEQIAWVARRKMIETGAAMYLGENHTEEDLAAVQRFMAEYGNRIHSWIADDRRIERVVESVTHDIQVHEGVLDGEEPGKESGRAASRNGHSREHDSPGFRTNTRSFPGEDVRQVWLARVLKGIRIFVKSFFTQGE